MKASAPSEFNILVNVIVVVLISLASIIPLQINKPNVILSTDFGINLKMYTNSGFAYFNYRLNASSTLFMKSSIDIGFGIKHFTSFNV